MQFVLLAEEGITRARVTRVMGMLRLALEIQQHIMAIPETKPRPTIIGLELRPIAQLQNATEQKARFEDLIGQFE